MSDVLDTVKRLVLGRPFRSDRAVRASLPKRVALPVFASDAISSVAYAPDEIILTLAVAGLAATALSPWVGVAVVVVMATVVASYRQTVRAYPSGGGDYEVATVNLGARAGLVVASALMVDYVLTVAVAVAGGARYASAVLPVLRGHEVLVALGLLAVLVLVNLRGVRESGAMFAVPVYLYLATVGGTAVVGLVRWATGSLPQAASAGYQVVPTDGHGLTGALGVFVVLRAFTSGSTALTGVEAISTGVPAFRRPRPRNAATTLALLGLISGFLMLSILFLARASGVRVVDDPATGLLRDGVPVGSSYVQVPVIGQLARAVFTGVPWAFALVAVASGLILLLAANTAFNRFPVLGSNLAHDGWMPRQLRARGNRLALSNGIGALAVTAALLVWVFDASVTALIPLYTVGVFVSFSLSQLGMLRHWARHLRTEPDQRVRARMRWSRVINGFGLCLTATVLVVVVVTKLVHGAWIAIGAMAVAYAAMTGVRRHYQQVAADLSADVDAPDARALPSRVHAIVLVSRLHRPTMRALAYARASRPSTLEAVSVAVDDDEAAALRTAWEKTGLPVPLKLLSSPYREITRPVLTYVRSIRRDSPRDLVVVYVPEYVVGHWWERLLHNQSATRLKSRLLFVRRVVVASVPWQLESSTRTRELAERLDARPLPGDTRRGWAPEQEER